MAAASSGDPGGSGEVWPGLGTSTSEFGALTYLLLASKDEKNPLKSDPFIVGKSVESAAGGPIVGASTEAQGTRYTLKVRNQVQVNKLLKLSALIDATEVVVTLHPSLNISRCVISCFEMIRMEEEDVRFNLASQGVIRVQRITRREHGRPVNTSALILTFNMCKYPSHVKVGVLRVNTRPYYPNPLLCYGCVRYGHPRARCPGPRRCLNCSGDHELVENQDCAADAYCINCSGSHRPNNRQCPVYKKEVEVIRIKVNQNLTYPEARKRIEAGTESYAAAVAQQTEDRKRLDELEKKMEAKDAQISQLLDIVKDRDKNIEKLSAYIKQLQGSTAHQSQSTPQNKQSQSSQPNEPSIHSQTLARRTTNTQVAVHSMQLRTRSPVTKEPKTSNNEQNKKKKRHNRSNNNSPGRHSPPPKKVVDNENTSDQDYQETISVDEDIVEETLPYSNVQ